MSTVTAKTIIAFQLPVVPGKLGDEVRYRIGFEGEHRRYVAALNVLLQQRNQVMTFAYPILPVATDGVVTYLTKFDAEHRRFVWDLDLKLQTIQAALAGAVGKTVGSRRLLIINPPPVPMVLDGVIEYEGLFARTWLAYTTDLALVLPSLLP